MADITTQLQLASSPPDQAAKLIGDANTFKMDADAYKEHEPFMQSEAELLKLNTNVTKGVADYSKQSSQHASLIKNDTFKLSQAETLFTKAVETFKGVALEDKITVLKTKQKSDPVNFSPEQKADLFMAEEELKTRQPFSTPPKNKYEDTINNYFESKKTMGTFESMFASYGAGLFNAVAGASQIPTLAYDAYYYPANLIRRFRGEPEIKAPESLTKNPVYQKFSKMADDMNALIPQVNKDITDSIANGDFAEAGEIAAIKLAGQIPNLTQTLGSFLVGGPVISGLTTGITSASQSNIENIEKGLTPTQSIPNAVTKAGIEVAMERIGTLSAFKRMESSLTFSFGKDAASKVIFNMGKAILGSAGQEAVEEGSTSILQDFTDIVSGVAPEKIEGIGGRALESALVGGLMGGGLVAPAAAIKAKSNILMDNKFRDAQTKAVSLLEFDSNMQNALEVLKETDMSKFSPEEQKNFMKGILKGINLESVWVQVENIREKANSPEKAAAVRQIIDPSGETAANLNASIKVPAHEWFALTMQFPEFQQEYSLSPEDASVKQAQEFLDNTRVANENRQQVLSKLETPDQTPEDVDIINQALNFEAPSAVYPSNDVYGEAEYMDTTNMETAMKGVISDSEIKTIIRDQTKAKQEIVDRINETAEFEMNEVVDVQMEEVMIAEKEAQLQRLESNPNLVVVDRFANPQSLPDDTILQSVDGFETLHTKKGYSPLAIDPSTLPDNLKYLKTDPRLKKNKVFVKGGLSATDSAALLGFESPEALLEMLVQTPSREEIAEQRVGSRKADMEIEAREQIGLNEVGITKAYNARLTNALDTLKIMMSKFQTAALKGFKGIALTPPIAKQLTYDAKIAVSKTKVGDLNVNQFKVGERKSERIAWGAVSKNQIEKAYKAQKAVAQNIALTAQTQIAIGKVNRAVRYVRKLQKASIQQELKDAGPAYVAAYNELVSVFNFGAKDNTVELNSFKKWVEQVAKEGNGDFNIPDRLLDTRQSFKEMTVEQVIAVEQALRGIVHTAKYKNKLFRKHENIKTLQTLEAIGNLVEENAKKVFDFDLDQSKTYQDDSVNGLDRAAEYLLGMKNYLERTQHVLVKLDDGNVNGFFNSLFYRPLVEASNAKKVFIKETELQLNKIIEQFGKAEWGNLSSEFVDIPEFKDFEGFKAGRFSKAQLVAMELNFGNEGNLVELEKFGGTNPDGSPKVSRAVIRKVLDRELAERHSILVQNIWDMYASLQPKMDALQRRTKGEDTEWVEAKPYVARGKQISGGYYPINRLADKLKIQARKAEGVGEMNSLEKFKLNYYGDAMTEQGHLKARTGNDDFVDLNLNTIGYSLNQIIHDLTHREVLADGVKLLADKKIRENIARVAGKEGYSNIVGTYIATAQEVETDSYGDNPIMKLVNNLGSGMQIVAIGGNINSILIQPSAVIVALDKMGKAESFPILYSLVNNMMTNPSLVPAFIKLAEEINPSIAKFTEDVFKNTSSTLNDAIPSQKNIITPYTASQRFISDASFRMLSEVDRLNKVLVTLTAYQLALQGKVKGLENLKGDVKESMVYASNMSELTQTHNDIRNLSPIQRNKYMKQFVYFFNDLNNLYNNSLAKNREIRKNFKKGNYWQGTVVTGSFILTLTMLKLFEQLMRGKALPGDDKDKPLAQQWMKFITTEVPKTLTSTIPILRDMVFAFGKDWEKRKIIQLPFEGVLSDFTTAAAGLKHYLEFWNENYEFTTQEKKALWNSVGIIGKLPTGTIYQNFIREKRDAEYLQPSLLERISKITNNVLVNPEVPQLFKDQLTQIEAQLNPSNVVVEPSQYDTIKEMVSNSNPTLYNEETGAAGIYQFTEETWNKIMQDAPELGLTENGRVMQKTEQQQKAFEYTAKVNGEILRSAGYEANTETLYASHILGAFKTVQVLSAEDSTKVDTLLSDKTVKQYKIPNDMTVRGFKDWLIFQTVKANGRLTNESNK